MKTAREMFEELGYKHSETETKIIYNHKKEYICIEFDKNDKKWNAGIAIYMLNGDEFKAIYQQIKELGWIE